MPIMTTASTARKLPLLASPRLTTATSVKTGEFLLRLWWDRDHPIDNDHRRHRAELLRVSAVAEELSLGHGWAILVDEDVAQLCYRDGLHRATAGLSIELASGDPAEQTAALQMLEGLAAMC